MTQEARDLAVDKVRKLEESISGGTFGGSATPASPNAKAPPAGAPPGDARVEGLVRDDERSTPKAKGARRASAVNVKAASGRNRSASISLAMMKATEETLGASVKVGTRAVRNSQLQRLRSRHSFRLIFGRAIVSRNGREAWMLFYGTRAEH